MSILKSISFTGRLTTTDWTI